MKLGSLFDGSGTAPLCAAILGWEPVWASEIEPFPIKVTSKRFPRMKHLGDITKIRGGEIEPVDVIVGGSPCQDLSVAGKQAGLQGGTRSHLFYEMTRIIKEMRRATNGKYPRYIVWENVPGAFSSNQGRDFHEVLKAFCSCADHPCNVPEPARGGGRAGADKLVWGNAGLVVGDGFSLGWRVLDAQYWGVPQRRRRIFLAVDLGGERAGEILFEREGLWRDPEQSREARKSTAATAVGSADRGAGAVWAIEGNCVDRNSAQNGRGYCENISPTLDAQDRHATCYAIDQQGGKGTANYAEDICPTICSDSHGTPHAVAAFMGGQGEKAGGIGYSEEIAPTLKSVTRGGNAVPAVVHPTVARTLTAEHDGQSLDYINPVVYPGVGITSKENASNPQPGDPCCTLDTDSRKYLVAENAPQCFGNGQMHQVQMSDVIGALNCMHDQQMIVQNGKPPRRYIVRRLTPMECCRLQGFPDWWVYGCENQPITGWWLENNGWMRVIDPHGEIDGSDSAIYKMWGNGMALPCMLFVLSGLEDGAS